MYVSYWYLKDQRLLYVCMYVCMYVCIHTQSPAFYFGVRNGERLLCIDDVDISGLPTDQGSFAMLLH